MASAGAVIPPVRTDGAGLAGAVPPAPQPIPPPTPPAAPEPAPPPPRRFWRRRHPTVRLHLMILALTALLPLWMLAGYTAWRAADARRDGIANDSRDAARNLAFVLEREMVGLRGALTALGSSPALQAGDFATFHAQAMGLQSVDGSRIRLVGATGQVLVDTSLPYSPPPQAGLEPAPPAAGGAWPVGRGGEPPPDGGTGTLGLDGMDGPQQVALTLEVSRGQDRAPVFLSIGTDPLRLWLGSLRRAALPPGWIALIADAEGRIIAREPPDPGYVGHPLPERSVTRQALASGQVLGWSRGRTREGVKLDTAWHRVGSTPWLVLVGLPTALTDGVLARALAPVLLLGGALLLLFTAGLTLWADRRIAAPLARTGRLAAAFGRGEPLPGLSRSGLREIDTVAEALSSAATAREALEAEQQALSARLRMVLESTTDGVLVLGPDLRIFYLNGRARAQLGGSADPVGRVLPEGFPGWGQGAFAQTWYRALAEDKPQRVTAFHEALGRWLSADAYPSPEGLTIFFRDVSAERAAEVALRENEALLKAVLDNVPVGVVVAEAPVGRMILSNRRTEEILRGPPLLSADVQAYVDDWECFHPDGRRMTGAENPLAQALQNGLSAVAEFRIRRRDDTLGWIRVSGAPVRDAEGRVTGAVAALLDIDAEHRAGEQLRESEQRFRTLAETIPQVVWSAQPDGTVDYVNPRLEDFTGLAAPAAVRSLKRLVHPDDQRRVERAWRRALHGGGPFAAELRLRRADGGWRWCVAGALPVRGAAAAAEAPVLRWIGTVTDVTDMIETREALARQVAAHAASREAAVQAAAALAVSESRFRRFAEASPDVLWMTDSEGIRPEFVSPAFERIWGVSQKALLTHPELWLEGIHAADQPRVRALLQESLNGGSSDVEYRVLRPDGGLRWIRDTGFPILDSQGPSGRRGGLARDITDAKAAEARQVLLLGELNHRVKNTLATVHSLALQTARTAGTDSEVLRRFLADFQARLLALSRGHDLLTARTWRGATLEEAARAALSPWQGTPAGDGGAPGGDEGRLRLDGPPAWLAPKQALGLALALHELATNATKHGALSRPEGRIHVTWSDQPDDMVELRWQESGGPPVHMPQRRGFGSRLLERGLPAELGAGSSVAMDYAEAGFAATIRFRPVNGPRPEEERP